MSLKHSIIQKRVSYAKIEHYKYFIWKIGKLKNVDFPTSFLLCYLISTHKFVFNLFCWNLFSLKDEKPDDLYSCMKSIIPNSVSLSGLELTCLRKVWLCYILAFNQIFQKFIFCYCIGDGYLWLTTRYLTSS